jgi:hypothetical protein
MKWSFEHGHKVRQRRVSGKQNLLHSQVLETGGQHNMAGQKAGDRSERKV